LLYLQLNLYGFKRITTGRDKGGYYHELFLRGMPDLAARILRTIVKNKGPRKAASPSTEPNLYTYPSLPDIPMEDIKQEEEPAEEPAPVTSEKVKPLHRPPLFTPTTEKVAATLPSGLHSGTYEFPFTLQMLSEHVASSISAPALSPNFSLPASLSPNASAAARSPFTPHVFLPGLSLPMLTGTLRSLQAMTERY